MICSLAHLLYPRVREILLSGARAGEDTKGNTSPCQNRAISLGPQSLFQWCQMKIEFGRSKEPVGAKV
jgi:hypothetical protein